MNSSSSIINSYLDERNKNRFNNLLSDESDDAFAEKQKSVFFKYAYKLQDGGFLDLAQAMLELLQAESRELNIEQEEMGVIRGDLYDN